MFAAPAVERGHKGLTPYAGLFPIEWHPVIKNARGSSPIVAAAGAILLIVMGVISGLVQWLGLGSVLLRGAVPWVMASIGLMNLGFTAWNFRTYGPGIAFLDSEGQRTQRAIAQNQLSTHLSILTNKRLASRAALGILLVAVAQQSPMLTAPVVLLILVFLPLSIRQQRTIRDNMQVVRFGYHQQAAPPATQSHHLMDHQAWVGLGHFIRGELEHAQQAWDKATHPRASELRAWLDPDPRPNLLSKPIATDNQAQAYRLAMLKAITAYRTGAPLPQPSSLRALAEEHPNLYGTLLTALLNRCEGITTTPESDAVRVCLDAIRAHHKRPLVGDVDDG